MFKSLLQLATASIVAQIISFGIMPIITRLHTPSTLGEYQFFTTVALVLAPLMSGSFAIAIKSSLTNYKALLNLKIAVQFTFFIFLILIVFSPLAIFFISRSNISWFSNYFIVLLFFVYFSCNFQFFISYMVNKRNYKQQSIYMVEKSLLSNFLKLIFSYISKSGYSLVWALVISEILQLFRILNQVNRRFFIFLLKFNKINFKKQIIKLKTYPTYVTLSSMVSILLNWLPLLLSGFFYGPKYTGLLGLAFMSVNTPIYPFVNILQNICFGELAHNRTKEKLFSVYRKVILLAVPPSILILIVLYFFGEELFSIVFGHEWEAAGNYALVCFLPIALSMTFSPVYSTLNHFFSFQKSYFIINLSFLVIGISGAIYIGGKSLGFPWFLGFYVILMCFVHLTLFVFSIFLTRSRCGS